MDHCHKCGAKQGHFVDCPDHQEWVQRRMSLRQAAAEVAGWESMTLAVNEDMTPA
jgi:hypothetical protein